MPLLFVLIGIAAFVLIVYMIQGPGPGGEQICTNCYTIGQSKRHYKGSFFIELILFLCFIINGIIYGIWRTSGGRVCPACGHETMIPVNTPRGQQLLRAAEAGAPRLKQTHPAAPSEITFTELDENNIRQRLQHH